MLSRDYQLSPRGLMQIDVTHQKYKKWRQQNGDRTGEHVHEWIPAQKRVPVYHDGAMVGSHLVKGFKCECKQVRYTDLLRIV